MLLPLSHLLPLYLDSKPLYDRLPRKISEHLMKSDGFVTGIDIGANIGDTVAAFMISNDNRFLAIEPNHHFKQYLDKNHERSGNVVSISVLCSSITAETCVVVKEQFGTACIETSTDGAVMKQYTLDEIIATLPEFNQANVLKIDTDGYDLKILLGARSFIERNQPAVLFECDAFSNGQYLEEFFRCISLFRECGYESFLLYDHLGYFMGEYILADPSFRSFFSNLLNWQMHSKTIYFDILFLPPEKMEIFHIENYGPRQ